MPGFRGIEKSTNSGLRPDDTAGKVSGRVVACLSQVTMRLFVFFHPADRRSRSTKAPVPAGSGIRHKGCSHRAGRGGPPYLFRCLRNPGCHVAFIGSSPVGEAAPKGGKSKPGKGGSTCHTANITPPTPRGLSPHPARHTKERFGDSSKNYGITA